MTWVRRLAGAAPFALVVLTVAYLALAAGNANPFWRWEPLNLSEAAALRDAGEVARLIEAGGDPNASYEVRAGILFPTARTVTPLEAAQLARRQEIVDLLRSEGAR
jgi:hypothetical protein